MNANTISSLLWFAGTGGLLYLTTRGGGCGGHRHCGAGGHPHADRRGEARPSAGGAETEASPASTLEARAAADPAKDARRTRATGAHPQRHGC